jgi:hypothetical protein
LTQAPSKPKQPAAKYFGSAETTSSNERERLPLSKFLLALFLFGVASVSNISFWPVNPLSSDLVPGKINAKGRAQRAADFFYNDENPDVIFLGTSLIFRASFESDVAFEHLRLPKDNLALWEFKRRHIECLHFQRLLEGALGAPIKACELGIPAAMASDYRELIEKLSLFDKTPRVVVCTLAPRDLFDNVYKDSRDTTSAEQIATCYPKSMWFHHTEAAWFYILRRWSLLHFLDRQLDAIKTRCFTYRYNFEQSFRAQLLKTLHQSTLPSTLPPTRPKPLSAPLIHNYNDLSCYQFSYNPPDFDEFARNAEQLRSMAVQCKKKGYTLLLVDMPVTPENRAQMTEEALNLYRKTLRDIAREYDLVLLLPDQNATYEAKDFVDSVHLTASGGQKFFQNLTDCFSRIERLRAAIYSR